MRTLTKNYGGGLPLEAEQYEADFEVVDKYQSFSAELLRLSLVGMTGYGFLIANIVLKAPNSERLLSEFLNPLTVIFLVIGMITLGISAATALGHRYFATDCTTHFIRRLRAESPHPEKWESHAKLKPDAIAEKEQKSLDFDVTMCRWLLIASSIFLIVGASCVVLSFIPTIITAL